MTRSPHMTFHSTANCATRRRHGTAPCGAYPGCMTILTTTARYSLLVATEGEQVRAAQRLRYRVFAEELGAALHTGEPGHDADEFDPHCDHLIIRDDSTGEVVGTY